MKIRDGFVSNSSSSSFLIIGLENDLLIDKILKAKNLTREEVTDEINFGSADLGDLVAIGNHECIYHIGEYVDESQLDSMPLLLLKQKLANRMKAKYNIDVPIEKLHLLYGESSS